MKQKTAKRIGVFAVIGVILTIIDYAIYEILILSLLNNGDGTSIASAISGIIATIIAFFMHSKITWQDRDITKFNIIKFFVWNIVIMSLLRPFLVWIIGSIPGLKDLSYNIFSWTTFGYDFIVSTIIYGLATIVTMTLNFLFYDKFVFKYSKHDIIKE